MATCKFPNCNNPVAAKCAVTLREARYYPNATNRGLGPYIASRTWALCDNHTRVILEAAEAAMQPVNERA